MAWHSGLVRMIFHSWPDICNFQLFLFLSCWEKKAQNEPNSPLCSEKQGWEQGGHWNLHVMISLQSPILLGLEVGSPLQNWGPEKEFSFALWTSVPAAVSPSPLAHGDKVSPVEGRHRSEAEATAVGETCVRFCWEVCEDAKVTQRHSCPSPELAVEAWAGQCDRPGSAPLSTASCEPRALTPGRGMPGSVAACSAWCFAATLPLVSECWS